MGQVYEILGGESYYGSFLKSKAYVRCVVAEVKLSTTVVTYKNAENKADCYLNI